MLCAHCGSWFVKSSDAIVIRNAFFEAKLHQTCYMWLYNNYSIQHNDMLARLAHYEHPHTLLVTSIS